MRYRLYLLLFNILLIFNTSYVMAEECDRDDINRLRELANNVNYSYEYLNDSADYQLYRVNFTLPNDEMYVVLEDNDFKYFDTEFSYLKDSGDYTIYIYSSNCFMKKLRTISLNLPKFNEYSLSDECKDINGQDLAVCDEWNQNNITDTEFDNAIKEYNAKVERENNIILSFIKDYYIYITIGIVIIVILIIFLIRKKHKDSRLT